MVTVYFVSDVCCRFCDLPVIPSGDRDVLRAGEHRNVVDVFVCVLGQRLSPNGVRQRRFFLVVSFGCAKKIELRHQEGWRRKNIQEGRRFGAWFPSYRLESRKWQRRPPNSGDKILWPEGQSLDVVLGKQWRMVRRSSGSFYRVWGQLNRWEARWSAGSKWPWPLWPLDLALKGAKWGEELNGWREAASGGGAPG